MERSIKYRLTVFHEGDANYIYTYPTDIKQALMIIVKDKLQLFNDTCLEVESWEGKYHCGCHLIAEMLQVTWNPPDTLMRKLGVSD
jgi:hypothetical protein